MHFIHVLRRTAAAGALALGSFAAQAAPLDYEFVVTLDASGNTYSGSLRFDNDPAGASPGNFGEQLFALTGFSFQFIDDTGASKTYGLTDLASTSAAVFGGAFVGINAAELGGAFQFLSALPAVPGVAPVFAFAFANGGFDTGVVGFRQVDVPVSAPASLGLVLAGLGLMGLGRRRPV